MGKRNIFAEILNAVRGIESSQSVQDYIPEDAKNQGKATPRPITSMGGGVPVSVNTAIGNSANDIVNKENAEAEKLEKQRKATLGTDEEKTKAEEAKAEANKLRATNPIQLPNANVSPLLTKEQEANEKKAQEIEESIPSYLKSTPKDQEEADAFVLEAYENTEEGKADKLALEKALEEMRSEYATTIENSEEWINAQADFSNRVNAAFNAKYAKDISQLIALTEDELEKHKAIVEEEYQNGSIALEEANESINQKAQTLNEYVNAEIDKKEEEFKTSSEMRALTDEMNNSFSNLLSREYGEEFKAEANKLANEHFVKAVAANKDWYEGQSHRIANETANKIIQDNNAKISSVYAKHAKEFAEQTKGSFYGTTYTPKIDNKYLDAARVLNTKAASRMADVRTGEGFNGFGTNFAYDLAESLRQTATLGAADIPTNNTVAEVFDKLASYVNEDNAESVYANAAEYLNEDEMLVYDAYCATLAAELARAKDTSYIATTSQMLAEMVPFFATMGIFNKVVGGANKFIQNRIMRGMTRFITNKLPKVGRGVRKAVTGLTTDIIGSGVYAAESAVATMLMPRTYAQTLQNKVDIKDYGFEGGKIIINELDVLDTPEALLKTAKEEWAGIYTEGKGLTSVLSNIAFKNPIMKKVLASTKGTAIGKLMDEMAKVKALKLFSDVSFNGTLGEWSEELEGAFWSDVFGNDKAFEEFFSKDTQIPMIASFMIPSAIGAGFNIAHELKYKNEFKKASDNAMSILQKHGYSAEDFSMLKDNIYATPTEDLQREIVSMAASIIGADQYSSAYNEYTTLSHKKENVGLTEDEEARLEASRKALFEGVDPNAQEVQQLATELLKMTYAEMAIANIDRSEKERLAEAREMARGYAQATEQMLAEQQAKEEIDTAIENGEEVDDATLEQHTREKVEEELMPTLVGIAFENGESEMGSQALYRVSNPSDKERKGYIVRGEATPQVEQGEEGLIFTNKDALVTVKWDDGTIEQTTLAKLNIDSTSTMAEQIEEEVQKQFLVAKGKQTYKQGTAVTMQVPNVQTGEQETLQGRVLSTNENGVEVELVAQDGVTTTTNVDYASATQVLSVVPQQPSAPSAPSQSTQNEPVQASVTTPDANTMNAEQLASSALSFFDNDKDAVNGWIDAQAEEAKREIQELQKIKPTSTDAATYKAEWQAKQTAFSKAMKRLQTLDQAKNIIANAQNAQQNANNSQNTLQSGNNSVSLQGLTTQEVVDRVQDGEHSAILFGGKDWEEDMRKSGAQEWLIRAVRKEIKEIGLSSIDWNGFMRRNAISRRIIEPIVEGIRKKEITTDNYKTKLARLGLNEQQIEQVTQEIPRRGSIDNIEGFESNGIIYLNKNLNQETARIKYVHERQHILNSKRGSRVADLVAVSTREGLADIVAKLCGLNSYNGLTIEKLADEFICRAMEIAYSVENNAQLENALRSIGANEQQIQIIKSINYEQQRDFTLSRARWHSLYDKRNEGRGGQNERDSRQVSRGTLGQQGTRPSQRGSSRNSVGEDKRTSISEVTQDTSLEESGIQINDETGDARFSVNYRLDDKQIDILAEQIAERVGVSKAKAKKWLKAETSLAALCMQEDNVDALYYFADGRYGAIKNNSDYPQGTVDFNNICRKRLDFTNIYLSLQREFPNKVFTAKDLETIRQIMIEDGLEVACGLCYVEDRRQLLGEIANEFRGFLKDRTIPEDLSATKKEVMQKVLDIVGDDAYIPTIAQLLEAGAYELRNEHPSIFEAFVVFNNSRGMMSGRLFEGYAEYKREILDWSDKKVKQVNDAGGLRIFSFSDFEAHHLIDIVQIISDAASKGVMIQGYTKVPEFARAIRSTKIKLNRSLIPLGDTGIQEVNGEKVLAYDTTEGIDVNSENFLDESNNPNVGNVLVGINDEQIRMAMEDANVNFIIPFHTGLKKDILLQKKIGAWVNYKNSQTEKDATTGSSKTADGKKVVGINIYTDVLQAAEKEGTPIKNRKEFVEYFLKVCKERDLVPRFEQFLARGKSGEYKYTKGYEKLLVDFKMFDKRGNILPQEPVVPIFDDAFNQQIIEDYVKGTKETKEYESTKEKIKDNLQLNESTDDLEASESQVRYSVVTDKKLLNELENGETIKVYRAMQLQDGKLYPPMSGKVEGEWRNPIELGVWEQADEAPDNAIERKGKDGQVKYVFKLDKGNKKSLYAAYNPYIHTSRTPLNDQFSEAQDRPELVTVEVEVPISELTSGYKAEKAKDAVGELEWKAGVVQGQLTGTRKVILSRYDKPIRIVPNAEVAERIVEMIDGKDVVFPSNVVTPQLREELEKKGVQFKETDNQGKPRFSISNIAEDAWNKYQYDGELESIRDVANYIEENMPKNEQTQALFDAIDAYNEEELEDRQYYGMRGDLEPSEDAILEELETLMNSKPRFSVAEGTQVVNLGNNTLVGLHNISQGKIRKAIKQGGLANPSAAVIDIAKQNHEGYGEITLVMPSKLVDSETGGNAGTYTGDAWSPTYPYVELKLTDKGRDKYYDTLREVFKNENVGIKNRMALVFENMLDNRGNPEMLAYWYLLEKGIEPTKVIFNSGISDSVKERFATLREKGGVDNLNAEERELLIELAAEIDGKTKEDLLQDAQESIKFFNISANSNDGWRRRMALAALKDIEEYGVRSRILSDAFYKIDKAMIEDGKLDVERTVSNARNYVEEQGMLEELNSWIENLRDRFGIKEVIFDGFDRNGNRKYVPNTLSNVSRLMNREAEQNSYSNTGLSATRAMLIERLETLEDIRNNKHRLVAQSEQEQEEWDQMQDKWFNDVIDPLGKMQKVDSNPFINNDIAALRLIEAVTKPNPIAYLNRVYKYSIPLNGTYAKTLNEMIKQLKEMPTKYFETKFKRPVYLNEFSAAVVPQGLAEDIKTALQGFGMPLFEYDENVEGSRREATLKATEIEGVRFSIIGEKGAEMLDRAEEATTRLDNLSIAREMENANKDAKTIKAATGWERGADGKWRYETKDVKLKDLSWLHTRKEVTLADIIDDNDLFKAYPQLANIEIKKNNKNQFGGTYNSAENTITIGVKYFKDYVNKDGTWSEMLSVSPQKIESNRNSIYNGLDSTIKHEVQHAIQYIEGFAKGGNPSMYRPDFDRTRIDEMADEFNRLVDKYNSLSDYDKLSYSGSTLRGTIQMKRAAFNRLAKQAALGLEGYKKLGGEVEARNVQKRASMSEEERRNTLLQETEDVAREDQIFIYHAIEEANKEIRFSLSNTNQRIFVSNAERAVESIKQEKATPQQWKAMIEKQGGLKVGEDKWLGLSEWLDSKVASAQSGETKLDVANRIAKNTITKQEILDYIAEHQIQIEEVEYAEDREETRNTYEFEYEKWVESFEMDIEDGILEEDADVHQLAFDEMVSKYGDDFAMAFEVGSNGELQLIEDMYGDNSAADYFLGGVKAINDTRLEYTTKGLENKQEIALTVPTIESWNERDNIHFGDAGDGRAIAWIRFGETGVQTPREVIDHVDALQFAYTNANGQDVYAPQGSKFSKDYAVYGKLANGEMGYVLYVRNKQLSAHPTLEAALDALNAHYEANPRQETDYGKVLVIDEIQSKRHQEGRDKGYITKEGKEIKKKIKELTDKQDAIYSTNRWRRTEDMLSSNEEAAEYRRLEEEIIKLQQELPTKTGVIPDAPFDKNWHELAFKRMLRYAAENGYDYVAWTTGEQQAERYNLGKHFDSIEREDNPSINGRRFALNGANYFTFVVNEEGVITDSDMSEIKGKPLADVVGKDLAIRMMSLEDGDTIEGADFRIGGEGMKGFYDKMLPSFVSKYTKKWGAKVQDINLPNLEESARTMHAVNVTQEMKDSVMEGQVMFSLKGAEELQTKMMEWLSDENLEWARGHKREDILEHFGNEPEPIALINPDDVALFPNVTDTHLYSGKGYLIDHAVHNHPELSRDEYKKIQTILDSAEDVKDVTSENGNPTYAFVKRLDKSYAVVAELSAENGRIMLHKTFFYRDPTGKRLPYASKPSVRQRVKSSVDGRTTINPAMSAVASHRNISALDDFNRKGTKNMPNDQINSQENENLSENPLFSVVNPTRQDVVTEALIRQASESYNKMQAAMKQVNHNLRGLHNAARLQREYDKGVAESVLNVVSMFMQNNWNAYMPTTINRLFRQVRNAIGKKDITNEVNTIMEHLTDAQMQRAKNEWEKLLQTKTKKVNVSGVVTQGKVGAYGQYALETLNGAIDDKLTLEDLEGRLSDIELLLGKAKDDSVRRKYSAQREGYIIAMDYLNDVVFYIRERESLKQELKNARKDASLSIDARNELVDSLKRALRENNLDTADAYIRVSGKLQDLIEEQRSAASAFVKAQEENRDKIIGYAKKDLEGVSSTPNRVRTKYGVARSIWEMFSSPIRDLQSLLRLFGKNAPDGEGYLYNHFMRGWVDAADEERKGTLELMKMLDAEVERIFGGKYKTFSDVAEKMVVKSKKDKLITISMKDIDENREYDITIGNALYIYAVNKMEDGKMKLRAMNITEEQVENMVSQIDPDLIKLVDWVQDVLFVHMRDKYNPVHERLFGAPMDAIDNYFPLKINSSVRQQNEDLSEDNEAARLLSGTSTSPIKRRTRNTLALDVLNADFFKEVVRHIVQMERWASFAQWNRDANILISNINFRNAVKNMSTIYGKGDKLFNYIKDAFKVSIGSYKSKTDIISETLLNIAKGVTSAKINFRLFTAFKQLASFPAFFPYMTSGKFVSSFASAWLHPKATFEWAKTNLPSLEKRISKRDLGDMRLMQRSSDWEWQKKMLEWSGNWGMSANIFFDTLTCATGAKAVYDSKYAYYVEIGMSSEDAKRKARQDAEQSFNTSQQSSEGAYMAPIQVDRNLTTAALTVFRTSSFQYTRNFIFHLNNLTNKLFKKDADGNMISRSIIKKQQIDFRKEQYLSKGLTDSQAQIAAERDYKKSYIADVVGIVTYGALLNLLWRLVGQFPYLIMGDDEDKKKQIVEDALSNGAIASPINGLIGGNVIESAIDGYGNVADILSPQLPLAQDAKRAFDYLKYDKYAEFGSLAFSVAMQSGTGIDPLTAADMITRIATTLDSEQELDFGEKAMRISGAVMSIPQSQYEQLLVDQINSKEDVKKALADYQRYYSVHTAPLTWYLRSEEEQKKIDQKAENRLYKLIREREEINQSNNRTNNNSERNYRVRR